MRDFSKKKLLIKAPFRFLGIDVIKKRPYPLQFLRSYGIRTVLDIGAYNGGFASEVRALFPDMMIHSFEPLSGPFKELKKSWRNDKFFQGWNLALGEETGAKEIMVNNLPASSSFLQVDGLKKYFSTAAVASTEQVQMTTLDEWADQMNIESEILLKADVQGYEGHVLRGAIDTLARIRALIIEVSFDPLYQDQPLFHEIYIWLMEQGFSLHGMFEPIFDRQSGRQLQSNAIFCKQ